MQRFPAYEFDFDRLTCCATHGDYFISQIICGENGINAVIDWTTACVHPVVWEIVRSYVYAASSCKDGQIDAYTDRMSDSRLGIFCLVGAVSTVLIGWLLVLLCKRICSPLRLLVRRARGLCLCGAGLHYPEISGNGSG